MHIIIGFAVIVGLLAIPETRKVMLYMACVAAVLGAIVLANYGDGPDARYRADQAATNAAHRAAHPLSPEQQALLDDAAQ